MVFEIRVAVAIDPERGQDASDFMIHGDGARTVIDLRPSLNDRDALVLAPKQDREKDADGSGADDRDFGFNIFHGRILMFRLHVRRNRSLSLIIGNPPRPRRPAASLADFRVLDFKKSAGWGVRDCILQLYGADVTWIPEKRPLIIDFSAARNSISPKNAS